MVISALNDDCQLVGNCNSLAVQIKNWLRQDWEVSYSHIFFREANVCADVLAHLVFDMPSDFLDQFSVPPREILSFVIGDSLGIGMMRDCVL